MRGYSFRFVVGALVALLGASIALEVLLGVHLIPLLLALLLLALGARMMAHAGNRAMRHGEAWLADRHFTPEPTDHDVRYDVVFGRGVIDLSKLPEPTEDTRIEVDTVFGSTVVKLAPQVAIDISGHSMFGEVRMPDRSMTAMGNIVYKTPAEYPPRLHLRVNAVFGSCQVIAAP